MGWMDDQVSRTVVGKRKGGMNVLHKPTYRPDEKHDICLLFARAGWMSGCLTPRFDCPWDGNSLGYVAGVWKVLHLGGFSFEIGL